MLILPRRAPSRLYLIPHPNSGIALAQAALVATLRFCSAGLQPGILLFAVVFRTAGVLAGSFSFRFCSAGPLFAAAPVSPASKLVPFKRRRRGTG
jgi:hypothetical protein